MYVVSQDVLAKIMAEAEKDPQHRTFLARCQELEECYGEVMERLSPEDREVIDSYFLACCQIQLDLLRVAYRCGKRDKCTLYPQF